MAFKGLVVTNLGQPVCSGACSMLDARLRKIKYFMLKDCFVVSKEFKFKFLENIYPCTEMVVPVNVKC